MIQTELNMNVLKSEFLLVESMYRKLCSCFEIHQTDLSITQKKSCLVLANEFPFKLKVLGKSPITSYNLSWIEQEYYDILCAFIC